VSPSVSVIIPTFDRGPVLREAIDSVLAQTYRDFDLIVVDDGSTDGTRELVESVYGGEARVRYLYQRNAGAASARNAGLDLATGQYVAFLDSDDAWKPWHLSLLVAALDAHPEAGMVWADMDVVDATGHVIALSNMRGVLSAYQYFGQDDLFPASWPLSELGIEIPSDLLDQRLYIGDVFSPMLMGNLVLTSSAVLRRDRQEQAGRFDERLPTGEDFDFFLRVCRGGPVAFADVADIRVRVGTTDRLSGTAMGLPIAKGYLQVLEATLARDGDRISLPPRMIDIARSYARGWVGEQYLVAGSNRIARSYLAAALRIRLWQPRLAVLLGVTFLPPSFIQPMFRLVRRLRGHSTA
jgi:GT2 family glycosyltransferase